nr:DUF882 domain-containing protein [Lichenihabitans psoromatis]
MKPIDGDERDPVRQAWFSEFGAAVQFHQRVFALKQTHVSAMIMPLAHWRWVVGFAVAALVALSPGETQTAIANGDTRTISLYHAHSHESITATFMVNGQYDQATLDKLNWFLRDWRNNETIKMDPRLFDTIWEVYRESGSQQPIEVMSAYRSPQTNAMLRRRSRSVAEHSQHILGRAMDQHYMDVPMSRIRELGMRLQRGGVGFYPTAGTPFVHLDVGGVRHWPRMSYDQLARLFPDGKTVHIPSNGQPLPHYEEARAELEARGDGADYPTATQLKSKGFFAWLFGGGGSDEDDDNAQAGIRASRQNQRVASIDRTQTGSVEVGNYGNSSRDGGTHSFFASQPPRVAFPSQPAPQPAAPAQSVAQAPPASAAPMSPPPAAAQQTLANAMMADERAKHQGLDAPQPAAVADLPSPGQPVGASDPTQAPTAPLPPRRPVELASLGPGAPLPPTRPTDRASLVPHDSIRSGLPGRQDSIGSLIGNVRVARLPDVITQGPNGSQRQTSPVLGYAAQPSSEGWRVGPSGRVAAPSVPIPVPRPPTMVSTHLDRSNFRSLTRPDTTVRTATRSSLGSVVPALRAAARSDSETLVPVPTARPSAFQPRASELPTDRFSGSVGKQGGLSRSGNSNVD